MMNGNGNGNVFAAVIPVVPLNDPPILDEKMLPPANKVKADLDERHSSLTAAIQRRKAISGVRPEILHNINPVAQRNEYRISNLLGMTKGKRMKKKKKNGDDDGDEEKGKRKRKKKNKVKKRKKREKKSSFTLRLMSRISASEND